MDYYGNNDFRDYQKTNDHLAHFAILGMKWGIRRFQPYSVHPRKGGEGGKEVGEAKKVATYKEKEIKKAEKAYDKDLKKAKQISDSNLRWLNRKKQAYENTTDEKKRAKLQEKIKNGEEWAKQGALREAGIEAMKRAEIQAIQKMTLSDIKAEKKAIGREVVKTIGFNLTGVSLGMLTGLYVYRTPSIRNIKTNRRLKLDDKKDKPVVTVRKDDGTVVDFDKKGKTSKKRRHMP